LVEQFGVNILSDEMKTPIILHLIYCSQRKIKAIRELEERSIQGQLNEERLFDLIYDATGSRFLADKTVAKFILNTTPKQ